MNTILCDIETAKSVVELPSPVAGTVVELHAAPGDTVLVGMPLVSVGTATTPAAAPAPDPVRGREPDPRPASGPDPAETGAEEAPLVLVGTAPAPMAARRRHLRARSAMPEPEPTISPVVAAEHREPVRGVRKRIAQAMTSSAFTAPHVTEWLAVDMTRTLELTASLRMRRDWEGVRVTPLLLVAHALLVAVRRNPDINAWWDDPAQEIVRADYVNLGIATATPRGLLVPNIKDAQRLGLRDLAVALDDLITRARAGRASIDALSRGTITITNIGALGVDAGTPILNPGEAAILAFGAIREMPWVHEGRIVVRRVSQLALSFDHRLVDGELGSAVLCDVARVLGDPTEALLG
ncbi:dihydrolipoamide acetyltransferase family protein [Nocardioides humi]|uniref:dihydrolipoamide acetyltransferase family protein n=1 Tax=Nocardioides humi TaxID=449461 RepID=UPI001FEC0B13|nr:dihydrolipoamide acetyltransferase family protein [Nocardioides humi]